jgi:dCTP deaminase
VILTDREIQLALEKKQIFIDPLPPVDHYSSTSVDLTLDPDLTIFNDDLQDDALENIIDPSHKTFVAERIIAKISRRVLIDQGGYVLASKKLILGSTRERIELPIHARLAARVEGKSSLARLGLGVHITAPIIHSGFGNPIRLEILNHGAVPIRLRAGMRICQLVFELTLGTPQKGFQQIQSAPPTKSS